MKRVSNAAIVVSICRWYVVSMRIPPQGRDVAAAAPRLSAPVPPCRLWASRPCFHRLCLCRWPHPTEEPVFLASPVRLFSFVTPVGHFLPLCLQEGALVCHSVSIDKLPSNGTKKKKKTHPLLTEHSFGRQLCRTTISLHLQADSNGILKVDACRGSARKNEPHRRRNDRSSRGIFWGRQALWCPRNHTICISIFFRKTL